MRYPLLKLHEMTDAQLAEATDDILDQLSTYKDCMQEHSQGFKEENKELLALRTEARRRFNGGK